MLRAYFNDRAAVWDERIAEKDTRKLEQLSIDLNLSPGSTVLDVGTGTGILIPFILNQLGERGKIIATDIADEMLKLACGKEYKGDIDYLQADVTSIPLNDTVADVVVCYSSFPHFQNKPRALGETHRVLKKDGRLLICHTSSREHINKIHSQIPAVRDDLLPDERVMRDMLLQAGFKDVIIADEQDSYFVSAIRK